MRGRYYAIVRGGTEYGCNMMGFYISIYVVKGEGGLIFWMWCKQLDI